MYQIKVDLKPKLKPMEILSYKGVSGNLPFTGSVGGLAGRRPQKVFRGKGLEFEKFREFSQGDDAAMIDWKATLRARKTLVKVYTEEQNKDIIILVDTSSSMVYSSFGKMKCEFAAELAASLSYALADSGDNVGFAMFGDKIKGYVAPASGKKQHYVIRNLIQQPLNYEGNFDFNTCLTQLAALIPRRALVFLITDFIGLKSGWENAYKSVAHKFEFIAICVRDPADDTLPEQEENVVVASPFGQSELLIDPSKLHEQYALENKKQLKHIHDVFRKEGDRFIILKTNEKFSRKLEKFFSDDYHG